MITITSNRLKDGQNHDLGQKERRSDEALSEMIEYEFGYGGVVTEAVETSVTVTTQIMGCTDTTTYSGGSEEMAPLYTAARLFELACNYDAACQSQTAAKLMQDTPAGQGVLPFYLLNAAPLMMGKNRLKVILMLASGVSDEAAIKVGIKLGMHDLGAALNLFIESAETSFVELLEQLAPTSLDVLVSGV